MTQEIPMMRTPWRDVDGVADRQPAYCPYCGHEGAFDGQGAYGDTYLHHCGECDQQFATVEPEVEL